MRFLRLFIFHFHFLIFSICAAFAQSLDSIIGLNEVTVTGARFKHFSTGFFYNTVDSVTKATEASTYLGDILNHATLFQVNSYGTGAVSVSARGMGEKRTPVVWNGFNIQNIMTTGLDLGQLPSSFFENVHAQMGGSSALFGSGAAGGVLFLNNKQSFGQGIGGQILSHTASFGNYYGGTEITASNNNYSFSVKGFYNTVKNNFPFHVNYYGEDIDTTQTNAKAKQYGLMMNNSLRLSSEQLLHVNLWYTKSKKNIAPTLYDISSDAIGDGSQNDDFYALSGEYVHQLGNVSLNARSGLFNSATIYEKPSWSQVSDNKALWWVNELESSANLGKFFKINGGINLTYERAKSSSFSDKKERTREALFTSFKFMNSEIGVAVTTNIRGEIVSGDLVPVTYSIGAEYRPFSIVVFKGNAARNYRLPSFNDLYYKDGWSEGNPNLEPETGMNYEFGFELGAKNKRRTLLVGINGFYSKMDNWINWQQREDLIWSVFNIDKAKISGIESFIEGGYNIVNAGISAKLMYTFTDARDRNTSNYIIYVPSNKETGILQLPLFKTSVAYHYTRVGKRYTTTDNSVKMEPYFISNIILSQSVKLFPSIFSFNLGVYNLFDKDYMVINEYPMPGRSLRVGLRIQF